jgi:hypothetical protein
MRLGLQPIPEEDQEVDLPADDPGVDLLVAAERTALLSADRETEGSLEDRSGGARGMHLVAREQFAIERGPFEQVTLLVVVRDQRDLLVAQHRNLDGIHALSDTASSRDKRESDGTEAQCSDALVAALSSSTRRVIFPSVVSATMRSGVVHQVGLHVGNGGRASRKIRLSAMGLTESTRVIRTRI